jgi:putative PIN family toxin of toxin-antitoxin system
MGKKVKVVFDSNVWISIFTNKVLSREFSEIINKTVIVYISEEILKEISRALTYPKINQILMAVGVQEKQVLRAIASNSTIVSPKRKIKCVKEDPDDDKIIECAIAANADVVLTGDKHLLTLHKFKKVKILSPREFLDSQHQT